MNYKLIHKFSKKPFVLAFLPLKRKYDIVEPYKEPITKWEKIISIFQREENQNLRPETCTIIGNTFGAFFTGFFFSGYLYGRAMLHTYIERNEATAYKSKTEAKRRLQDNITFHIMKGGFSWGIRFACFTGLFTFCYIVIGIVRQNHSVWNLGPAACCIGTLYKIPLGFRGMISGGVIGGFLGLCCSLIISPLLLLTNRSFEQHMYTNYKFINSRDNKIYELKHEDERWGIEKEGHLVDSMLKSKTSDGNPLHQTNKNI